MNKMLMIPSILIGVAASAWLLHSNLGDFIASKVKKPKQYEQVFSAFKDCTSARSTAKIAASRIMTGTASDWVEKSLTQEIRTARLKLLEKASRYKISPATDSFLIKRYTRVYIGSVYKNCYIEKHRT